MIHVLHPSSHQPGLYVKSQLLLGCCTTRRPKTQPRMTNSNGKSNEIKKKRKEKNLNSKSTSQYRFIFPVVQINPPILYRVWKKKTGCSSAQRSLLGIKYDVSTKTSLPSQMRRGGKKGNKATSKRERIKPAQRHRTQRARPVAGDQRLAASYGRVTSARQSRQPRRWSVGDVIGFGEDRAASQSGAA